MELMIQLNGSVTRFVFEWQPLRTEGKNCYAWRYSCSPKPLQDEPVIYQHVLETQSAGAVPIYIGEGRSLAGHKKLISAFNMVAPMLPRRTGKLESTCEITSVVAPKTAGLRFGGCKAPS
jgi:hypothetical protein